MASHWDGNFEYGCYKRSVKLTSIRIAVSLRQKISARISIKRVSILVSHSNSTAKVLQSPLFAGCGARKSHCIWPGCPQIRWMMLRNLVWKLFGCWGLPVVSNCHSGKHVFSNENYTVIPIWSTSGSVLWRSSLFAISYSSYLYFNPGLCCLDLSIQDICFAIGFCVLLMSFLCLHYRVKHFRQFISFRIIDHIESCWWIVVVQKLLSTRCLEILEQRVALVSVSGLKSSFRQTCVGIQEINASPIRRVRSPDLFVPVVLE